MLDIKQRLLELANDALEQTGDYGNAADLLCQLVTEDKELYDYIVGSALHKECSWLVRTAGKEKRDAVWNRLLLEKAAQPQHGDRLRKSTKVMSLFAFPTISGKPLKDANREEVLQTASFYKSQAKDMRWKAAWLYQVCRKMDNSRVVEQCFTEGDLEKLKDEARSEVA